MFIDFRERGRVWGWGERERESVCVCVRERETTARTGLSCYKGDAYPIRKFR